MVYEPFVTGLTLNVPARGIWRGSAGLFVFSLIWCGFMVVFTGAMVFLAAWAPVREPQAISEWITYGQSSPSWRSFQYFGQLEWG